MRLPRLFEGLRRRRSNGLTGRHKLVAEAQAMADAEDMIRRLGVQWAYLVADEHARAERTAGVGAGLFPPGHWRRVCECIQRVMRPRRG